MNICGFQELFKHFTLSEEENISLLKFVGKDAILESHKIGQLVIKIHVNLDFRGKQGNNPESPLFYFHRKGYSSGT